MKSTLLMLAIFASLNTNAAQVADSTAPLPQAKELANPSFWQSKGPDCNDAVRRERNRVISNTIFITFIVAMVGVVIYSISKNQKP